MTFVRERHRRRKKTNRTQKRQIWVPGVHEFWNVAGLREIVLDYCELTEENSDFFVEFADGPYLKKEP